MRINYVTLEVKDNIYSILYLLYMYLTYIYVFSVNL